MLRDCCLSHLLISSLEFFQPDDLVAIIVVDNQLSFRDIRTHDQLTYLHCHGPLLTLWFFGLKGVSPRGAGLFLSSLANDAFFIGALVEGVGRCLPRSVLL
ncbi:hypothetical protein PPS11_42764 [Pseudomonas putida S11]|nr:hypothetical protein PPS11_42764 [Pseudomonas putida S11]